jgi:thiamine biosynthesis lipoprotein
VALLSGRSGDLAEAVRTTRDVMNAVQRSADRFDPTSDLSRVNAAAGRQVAVDPLTLDLVDLALASAHRTDGFCDPTVGSALLEAGYISDIADLRGRTSAIGRRRPAAGWHSVTVDRERGLLGVEPNGLLDLGATAKAWAADAAAAEVLARTGLGGLVSIGGDLAVSGAGEAADQRPWLVDVTETVGGHGQQVAITRGGLATSSVVARRWNTGAGAQHHIIDPRTGTSARGPWRTSTVWAESAYFANEASTAAIIHGSDAPAWLAARRLPARLVHRDGWVLNVGGWPSDEVVA